MSATTDAVPESEDPLTRGRVLPYRDENPTEITPLVTVAFLAMNVAAWFLLQGGGEMEQLEASVYHFGTYPCELTTTGQACPVAGPGWGSLFSSMFMHGSWGHILGNMLFLWVFGNNIEDSMGHLRFIVFYLVCGVVAGLAHVYSDPASNVPAVGASGAISGVMGGYIVLYPRARVRTWIPPIFFIGLPAFFMLGYWFFVQLAMAASERASGEQGGVAVWAHVGGFVAGAVLIKLFEKRALVEAKKEGRQLPPEEVARIEW